MVTNSLTLNLRDQTVIPRIVVPQYDSVLRMFEFRLLDGDNVYTIPSNVTITLQGTKRDLNIFVESCTYTASTGIVRVNCTEQMTAVPGDVRCNLVLVDSFNNRIGSFLFYIEVEEAGVEKGTPQIDSQLSYTVQVLNDIQSRSLLKFIKYENDTLYFSRVGNTV